jgi:hypothetical protein
MRREASIWLTAYALALLVHIACGDTLHVPAQYPTIGAAFDAVQDDDTVLVSLGTYAEELTAPPRRFWLMGDVEADTGDFPRPVIDPSTMDSAQWRKCLTIPDSCQLTIERMKFVNRAPMYPRTGWNSGGIFVHTVEPTIFRYCAFDSVYRAIVDAIDTLPPPPLPVRYVIENCRFVNAPRIQVRGSESDSFVIRSSYFEAHLCTSMLILGGHQAWVEDCVFKGDSVAGALHLNSFVGGGYAVRGCTFGPLDICSASVVRMASGTQAEIEDNVLQQIGSADVNFAGFRWVSGDPITIRHNQFIDNHSLSPVASLGLRVDYVEEPPAGYSALIDSNDFVDCASGGQDSYGKALAIWAPAAIRGNRFVNLSPAAEPTMIADEAHYSASQLRYNQFEAGDYAVRSETYEIDAIYNYWGDPSGPYNALHNPGGQGARVDDLVLFDPWSRDTNFLSVPGVNAPLPEGWSVEMFPNPFNSTLMVRFRLANRDRVKVDVFDILGRRVRQISDQPYSPGEHSLLLNGTGLSSGVYVIQLKSPQRQIQRKAVLLK